MKSIKDKREILDIVNELQNERNSFVNFDNEDLEIVYNFTIKRDLDRDDIRRVLIDLAYV